MFTIIYDDKYKKQSLSKYTGIITYDDAQKIIKNHKDWFEIDIEDVKETKEIIKKIFNLGKNIKILGSTYKDALVMHIDSENLLKDTYYCMKIIDNKVEAYLLKGKNHLFIDYDENFFDFIENIMFDGVNTYQDL